MPFSLNLQTRIGEVAAELTRALDSPGDELARAALAIARVEYRNVETQPYVEQLDRMGSQASARIGALLNGRTEEAIRAFNEYLYDELGFSGNRERYDDPRNCFLNEVLDRRTGIPITLAVVYLEVARRARLPVQGVNFPGHFLLRVPGDAVHPDADVLIVDPFHGGAILSEVDCRELLRQHVGADAAFGRGLLAPATRQHIVVRMLVNLKRLYVRMRSFPQARFISDLLLAAHPSGISELRDRGLLAYHLQDFSAALRDLESYLRLVPKPDSPSEMEEIFEEEPDGPEGESPREEYQQIWEHVKILRKRVAGFN